MLTFMACLQYQQFFWPKQHSTVGKLEWILQADRLHMTKSYAVLSGYFDELQTET